MGFCYSPFLKRNLFACNQHNFYKVVIAFSSKECVCMQST
jgi:hypothetical protein